MTIKRATVKRVWRDVKGSPLAAATVIGATEATVDNVVDFDEDGGEFVLGDDAGTYSGIDEGLEKVLGLDPPLTAAHPVRTFLQQGATKRGAWYADCYVEGDRSLTTCEVMWHIKRYLPKGTRSPEVMEVVEVRLRPDGMPVIVDAPETDDVETEDGVPLIPVEWSLTGPISEGVRQHQLAAPFSGSIEEARLMLGEDGIAGGEVVADILVDGVSILTTKLVVDAGDTVSPAVEPADKQITKGQILQVEFEDDGGTPPGWDPTIYLLILPANAALGGRIEVLGPVGPGVPAGGAVGQFLRKLTTDHYETEWADILLSLAGLTDVSSDVPGPGDVLLWNDALELWVPGAAPGGGGGGAALLGRTIYDPRPAVSWSVPFSSTAQRLNIGGTGVNPLDTSVVVPASGIIDALLTIHMSTATIAMLGVGVNIGNGDAWDENMDHYVRVSGVDRVRADIRLTGLTPETTITLCPVVQKTGGTTTFFAGRPTSGSAHSSTWYGPAKLEAWEG